MNQKDTCDSPSKKHGSSLWLLFCPHVKLYESHLLCRLAENGIHVTKCSMHRHSYIVVHLLHVSSR
jgi:hypothetical protein